VVNLLLEPWTMKSRVIPAKSMALAAGTGPFV